MKKFLIALLIVTLMVLSSGVTFFYLAERSIAVTVKELSGKIMVAEREHLAEISKIKNFSDLMESAIKNKIEIQSIFSEYPDTGFDALTMDISLLHMRLGFLYEKNGKKDMANAEFETALTMFNSTRAQPIDLERMIQFYEGAVMSLDHEELEQLYEEIKLIVQFYKKNKLWMFTDWGSRQ